MSFSFSSTPQHQQLLFIKDGTPATLYTKWEDLHPHSQKFLLQIEERILEYRDESQRLDQSSRLYKCSVSNDGFKSDISHIAQVLGVIKAAMEQPRKLQQEMTSAVKNMLCHTEKAVRSFMVFRPRFLHPSKGNALSTNAPSQTSGVTITPRLSSRTPDTLMPVPDFYCRGLLNKPSSFFCQTVSRFEKCLGEFCHWIEQLDLLLIKNAEGNTSDDGSFSLESLLPKVLANMHDIFIYVATKVERSIHQHMNEMKSAYQVKHRGHRQEKNDPLQNLLLPEDSQPSAKLAGLFSSSGTVGPSTAPHTSPLTSNSSASGLSVFSMPSSVPSSSLPSLFTTPTTSAPVSPLSGSSSATTSGRSTSSTSSSLGVLTSTVLKSEQLRSRTRRR